MRGLRRRRWLQLPVAALGGLLTDRAFPDTGWWPCAILGLAVLLVLIERDRPLANAGVGFAWGLGFFLPHVIWAELAVGAVPWLALSIASAGFPALFALLLTLARRAPGVRRRRSVWVPTATVLWVAVEELRSAWPFGGFPWGRLAFSQADSPLGRLAWLGGTAVVSAAVVLLAALLARTVLDLRRLSPRAVVTGLIAAQAVVVAGVVVPLDSAPQAGTLRIGIVQGNVSDPGLGAFANRREVLDNHLRGTVALLDHVDPGDLDLVLWPENGSDIDPQADAGAGRAIDAAARAVGAPLLIGAQEYPGTGGRYNVSLLWAPGEGVIDRYAKQHPVPFAEYIPWRPVARVFSDAVDLVRTDMLPGVGSGLVSVPSERLDRRVGVATVICFEVAYDALVREAVRDGGEMLVVQTNNATFGRSAESTQQLAMSRLRAIETGRATVQVSTVGVSAVIAPNGVVTQRTELFTADERVARVPLRDGLTPAVRAGEWPARIVVALGLLVVIAGLAAGLRRDRGDASGRDVVDGPGGEPAEAEAR